MYWNERALITVTDGIHKQLSGMIMYQGEIKNMRTNV